jgi:hypothetical protein
LRGEEEEEEEKKKEEEEEVGRRIYIYDVLDHEELNVISML